MKDEQRVTTDINVKSSRFEDLSLAQNAQNLAADLLQRCGALLAEVETFSKFLADQKREDSVEMRHFTHNVKAEYKSLERLSKADTEVPRTLHTLRSSNFPFYAAVWNTAKSSVGVVALEKKFYWKPKHRRENGDIIPTGTVHSHCSALVDIVCHDGSEWIKISTVTEKRIFFDLAKAGWVGGSSSGEDGRSDDEDSGELKGIIRQASALSKASKALRVRYRHPRIRFLLSKVVRGRTKEVDQIIEKVEALGVKVETADDLRDAPPILEVLQKMIVDQFTSFTATVNIDCTIMLAFVSDLSHGRVAPESWHHHAILQQIEMEQGDQLLPNSLWPACGLRNLVCTREAVTRMHEIVDLIGTDSEKRRRDCLLMVDLSASLSREERIRGFQELSEYDVPLAWKLPIAVVESELNTNYPPPSIAEKVMDGHSIINKAVFLYGWAAGLTTISSNRTVAKYIESAVEANRGCEDDEGPDIWLCPTARSLVGKERTKRNRIKFELDLQ